MTPVYIYTLSEGSEIRYVGQTSHPDARLSNHRHAGAVLVRTWIAGVEARGGTVTLKCVATVGPGQDANAVEKRMIAHYRLAGCDLFNGRRGRHASKDNAGAQKLRALQITQAEVTALLGVAHGVVCRWARGLTKPDSVMRARLEDDFGIFWRLWDQPAEAAKRSAA